MIHRRQSVIGLFIAVLVTACGGDDSDGSGEEPIAKATPPSDVCGMLTLTDVQGLFPGAMSAEEQPTADTSDVGFWVRDCKWTGDPTSVSIELVVFGATTREGLEGIRLAASSGTTNTEVSGLGDEAHYWEDEDVNTGGLWALEGSYSVDVTAYFFTPLPAESLFHPLVEKALGELD
jgi:hypothetical protein